MIAKNIRIKGITVPKTASTMIRVLGRLWAGGLGEIGGIAIAAFKTLRAAS